MTSLSGSGEGMYMRVPLAPDVHAARLVPQTRSLLGHFFVAVELEAAPAGKPCAALRTVNKKY